MEQIRDFLGPVVRNVDLGHGNHLMAFEVPEGVLSAIRPAQFFMIGIPGADVLLRRPFSVCGIPGTFEDAIPGTVQVLYRVYGRATTLLAALAPGAPLHVLGPLGRGFEPPSDPSAVPVFVAGGIGSAPYPAFLAELARSARPRPVMVYGARTASELPLLDWFRRRCERVIATTEDGSEGIRGRATDPLEDVLRSQPKLHLYACGPTAMLKAVARIALARDIPCDLSLEAPMACGFGVCLGCVLPVRGESPGEVRYERCCVEGPVMPAKRLAW